MNVLARSPPLVGLAPAVCGSAGYATALFTAVENSVRRSRDIQRAGQFLRGVVIGGKLQARTTPANATAAPPEKLVKTNPGGSF